MCKIIMIRIIEMSKEYKTKGEKMTLETVTCVHCDFVFRIDIDEIVAAGTTTYGTALLFSSKQKCDNRAADIKCQKCEKIFEFPQKTETGRNKK